MFMHERNNSLQRLHRLNTKSDPNSNSLFQYRIICWRFFRFSFHYQACCNFNIDDDMVFLGCVDIPVEKMVTLESSVDAATSVFACTASIAAAPAVVSTPSAVLSGAPPVQLSPTGRPDNAEEVPAQPPVALEPESQDPAVSDIKSLCPADKEANAVSEVTVVSGEQTAVGEGGSEMPDLTEAESSRQPRDTAEEQDTACSVTESA